jgi:hypothetical protein
MAKEKLEKKLEKTVVSIEKSVKGIYDILNDLSLKLCHIIKDRRSYYDMLGDNEFCK